ncbi:CcdB protein [Enterovirga rhinocerotis]|uniref:Toxin CcdB n=2 Tax=Enterovirga rhinocerotis TaxID=1339210 RepID=A0A4R7BS67_9HYPH|nr:CcdB protein [Enterovirga rhinocerotis]
MRQFSVCRLKGRSGTLSGRLVVVLQHDLLSDLRTRIVAPLLSLTEADAIGRIAPEVAFGGRRYRLCLYELMTIDISSLSEPSGTVDVHDAVMRGIDQIFAGV